MQAHPSETEDYRGVSQLHDEGIHEHHTFKLPKDKTLRAVVRVISKIVTTDEAKQNLMDMGFDDRKILNYQN